MQQNNRCKNPHLIICFKNAGLLKNQKLPLLIAVPTTAGAEVKLLCSGVEDARHKYTQSQTCSQYALLDPTLTKVT